ncbi:TRP-like ion channel Pkd2 [Perkinsus olseni]|uniref:TRP-like ion channel Pkd2 n=1 Tax=Perkinsus olseni TaxID=32597 RepID=A0A7J6PFF7_PEROL|nr:TRP-like ion channel Pkd2 [Perkinsus olseni]
MDSTRFEYCSFNGKVGIADDGLSSINSSRTTASSELAGLGRIGARRVIEEIDTRDCSVVPAGKNSVTPVAPSISEQYALWLDSRASPHSNGDYRNAIGSRESLVFIMADVSKAAGRRSSSIKRGSIARDEVLVVTRKHLLSYVRRQRVRLVQERSSIEVCDDEVMEPIYTSPTAESSLCHPLGSSSEEPIAGQGGRFGFEPNEDGQFVYYIDGSRGGESLVVGQRTATQLSQAGWLDLSTKSVKVEAILFNGETNMFMHVDVSFEVQRGGAIIPLTTARTLISTVYNSVADYVIDFVWLALIGYLTVRELRQIYMVKRIGRLKYYVGDFWTFVDWLTIIGGIGVGVFYAYLAWSVGSLKEDIVDISQLGEDISPSDLDAVAPSAQVMAYYQRWGEIYDTMNTMIENQVYHRLLMFWYTIINMLRFFRAFRGLPRLAVIADTMKRAWMDVAYFLIVFCTVFFNFVLGGYTLFGKRLKAWSTPGDAINTAFVALMGDFDYNAMRRVAPVSAAIWFWFYMVLVFLVMLNMLLAIVMDTYTSVKDEACAAELFSLTSDSAGLPHRKFLQGLGILRGSVLRTEDPAVASYMILDKVLEAFEPSGFHVKSFLDLDSEAKARERKASEDKRDADDIITVSQLTSIGIPLEDAKRLIQGAREMFKDDEPASGDDDYVEEEESEVTVSPMQRVRGHPTRMQRAVNQLLLKKNNTTPELAANNRGAANAGLDVRPELEALKKDVEFLKDRVAFGAPLKPCTELLR